MTTFAFASCWPDAAPAVKAAVAKGRPDLRLAYSRPGLLTFKSDRELPLDTPSPSPFARVWGRSLGAVREAGEGCEQIVALGIAQPCVHVYPREAPDLSDRDQCSSAQELIATWQARLRSASASSGVPLRINERATVGETIVDWVVAKDEPSWLGIHRHTTHDSPWPGGAFPVDLPEDAPSRAYAKIEEAIAWADLEVRPGDVALEIGAAPGGAALALARRGVSVYGVDTAAMAPNVVASRHAHGARVVHIATSLKALRIDELPPHVDWLLVDVNLSPHFVLSELSRLMPTLRRSLRGAVLTLKMNDWGLAAQLDQLTAKITTLGLPRVQLRHLPSNRREICAVALP